MKIVNGEQWLQDREVIHRNDKNGGLLVRLEEGRVGKVFPYKGWLLGWGRILRGTTKAHKQARSMECLLKLGLRTPRPLEVVSFRPSGGPYEGVLLYEFVEDVTEVRDAVMGGSRKEVLERVADELVVMAKAGVLFVDLHPGNVLIGEDFGLCWIDVEVVESARFVRKSFWSRVVRMRQKGTMADLSEADWLGFCRRIDRGLPEGLGLKGRPAL